MLAMSFAIVPFSNRSAQGAERSGVFFVPFAAFLGFLGRGKGWWFVPRECKSLTRQEPKGQATRRAQRKSQLPSALDPLALRLVSTSFAGRAACPLDLFVDAGFSPSCFPALRCLRNLPGCVSRFPFRNRRTRLRSTVTSC